MWKTLKVAQNSSTVLSISIVILESRRTPTSADVAGTQYLEQNMMHLLRYQDLCDDQ